MTHWDPPPEQPQTALARAPAPIGEGPPQAPEDDYWVPPKAEPNPLRNPVLLPVYLLLGWLGLVAWLLAGWVGRALRALRRRVSPAAQSSPGDD